ncbi:MAG: hypothetical protein H5T84_11295, partial [Thermoleophilia bacterium]|nr:hypothetical protein [Thermoleophilia bacterium]
MALTHLDRVYFPAVGLRKGDLVDYYLKVAPYLLPHLKDRPLTLERWPEGLEDGSFFQKDAAPYFPAWLHTFPVERKDHQKIVHYTLVEDEADLLYLVNLGTLTFHTQLSRITDPDHPDLMVLDIDPPEGPRVGGSTGAAGQPEAAKSPGEAEQPKAAEPPDIAEPPGVAQLPDIAGSPQESEFRRAAAVAFLLRDELIALGMEPLVKTSGKRGVHLAFRLTEKMDYTQARAWLNKLFADLARRHPDLLTTEIRKEKRHGRVYLDALRMSPGATIVPPYVVRATPMATVSTPVTWEELSA